MSRVHLIWKANNLRLLVVLINQAISFRASLLLSQLSPFPNPMLSFLGMVSHRVIPAPLHPTVWGYGGRVWAPRPPSITPYSCTRLLTRVNVSGSATAGGVYVAIDPSAARVCESLRNELDESIQFFTSTTKESRSRILHLMHHNSCYRFGPASLCIQRTSERKDGEL